MCRYSPCSLQYLGGIVTICLIAREGSWVVSIDRSCFRLQFRRILESSIRIHDSKGQGPSNKRLKKFVKILDRSNTCRLIPLTVCLPSQYLKKNDAYAQCPKPFTLIFICDDSDTPMILLYNIDHTIDNRNGRKGLIISKSAQHCFAV